MTMAEKEYIERGALIAAYDRAHKGPPGGARKLMEDAPAADVVEVVRCKDCIHCGTSLCAMNTYEFDIVEEGFCSYGEREMI